ncbi:MAG: glycosyltransferase family 2 protein [Armatimonadota bacterium]|nr:glycosyltransferase family 2 protein [Armatimonadota bacterium]MDR7444629.1 glycosyltransferase family 2 protein [Armatimonadota bacterium]MDR7569455.1 glycosyltransferase family 2 protein [Armatimonadota bacterium]MDR7613662.1 glycosyltransferase family 2 protein [Armatimonadota bacterium]
MRALGRLLDLCAPTGALFWAYAVWAYRGTYRPRFLEDVPIPEGPLPPLRVVVPARNEEARVARTIRSLLAQRYPDLRVVAVDDRSTDRTAQILERLRPEDPRLEVVPITGLPPGWLGKPHALHAGVQGATEAWVLFTDGDVVFGPDVLARAVGAAEREGLDHLAVFPHLELRGIGERAVVAVFGLLFGVRQELGGVADPRSRGHVGIGAFNLVRRTALEAIGGVERLRLSVVDDVELGRLIKAAGLRQGFLFSRGSVRVRWQEGVWGFVEGLEKNAFAAAHFRAGRALLLALGLVAAHSMAPLAIFSPRSLARACAAWVWACLAVAYATLRGLVGGPWWLVFLHPVASLALPLALLRSAWRALRRGGIEWRGTFYPLAWFRGIL